MQPPFVAMEIFGEFAPKKSLFHVGAGLSLCKGRCLRGSGVNSGVLSKFRDWMAVVGVLGEPASNISLLVQENTGNFRLIVGFLNTSTLKVPNTQDVLGDACVSRKQIIRELEG